MKHTDAEYLNVDLFQGEEADLTCRTVKLVTTRKAHPCHAYVKEHDIPAGDRARHERALVDGDFWGSYYACLPCLDRVLSEYVDDDDED
jgi:hypothetical protein